MAFAQLDAPRAARSLLTVSAVAERGRKMLELATSSKVDGLRVDLARVDAFSQLVISRLNKNIILPQPASLYDDETEAHAIFAAILRHQGVNGPITLGGINLGDSAMHPLMLRGDASDGIVPFHAAAMAEAAHVAASRIGRGESIAGAPALPLPTTEPVLALMRAHGLMDGGSTPAARACAIGLGLIIADKIGRTEPLFALLLMAGLCELGDNS